jgi:hypothetical protein
MNTWKPIETAPKNGTPILVGCWQSRRVWNKDTQSFDKAPDAWVAATVFWCRLYEGEWVLVEAGDYSDLPTLGRKVTHWTEIPAPPQK